MQQRGTSRMLRSSSRERGVGERRRFDQLRDRVAEQELVLSIVEAEFKLAQVAVKVLGADLMEGADYRPLEQRPHALHAVRVDIAAYPFLCAVVDTLVDRVVVPEADVAGVLIREDALRLADADIIDESLHRLSVTALLDTQADRSVALYGTHDHRLVTDVAAPDVATLAADPGLVYFDGA